ncbi:MAG: hypothetical protein U1E26_05970 [Coriobacteriia bacterium]|nr:hypothetical protein [Coriobacteriia bacterium]
MRKTVLIAAVSLVFALLLGVGVWGTVWGPERCAACHTEPAFVSASAQGAHASVDCLQCHSEGGAWGRIAFNSAHLGRMVPSSTWSVRDVADVADARCLSCHDKVDDEAISANGIRVDHSTCAYEIRCTECHSTTAHGSAVSWVRTYDMETCLQCHASDGSVACDLCHVGRSPENRIRTGVFAITHGPEWERTHGMGDSSTCAACHTAADCGTCHGPGLPHDGGFMKEHSTFSQDRKAKCESCHEPQFCDGCHGLSMPHPRRFVIAHGVEAEQNRTLCSRCHVDTDCSVCHVKHVHPGGAVNLPAQGGAAQ